MYIYACTTDLDTYVYLSILDKHTYIHKHTSVYKRVTKVTDYYFNNRQ